MKTVLIGVTESNELEILLLCSSVYPQTYGLCFPFLVTSIAQSSEKYYAFELIKKIGIFK